MEFRPILGRLRQIRARTSVKCSEIFFDNNLRLMDLCYTCRQFRAKTGRF